jgi:16S rRNA (uracil1498-N3)-methyltransferase
MTRRRWIADEVFEDRAALTGEHADHLVRVLRARVGQEFDIATGGTVRRGRIVAIAGGRLEFQLGDEVGSAQTLRVTLLLSVFKFDRMEWAIEKCTELGVSRIVPVTARRTDTHLAAAAAKRVERWRRIALQAAEQSRRVTPPEIADPAKLADVIHRDSGHRIVLSEEEKQTSLRDLLESRRSAGEDGGEIILALGPEGGWTAEELQDFSSAGWMSASLGSTILRAETAAIAALAIVMSALA